MDYVIATDRIHIAMALTCGGFGDFCNMSNIGCLRPATRVKIRLLYLLPTLLAQPMLVLQTKFGECQHGVPNAFRMMSRMASV